MVLEDEFRKWLRDHYGLVEMKETNLWNAFSNYREDDTSHGPWPNQAKNFLLNIDLRAFAFAPISIPPPELLQSADGLLQWPKPVLLQLVRAVCVSAPTGRGGDETDIVLDNDATAEDDVEEGEAVQNARGRMKYTLGAGSFRITLIEATCRVTGDKRSFTPGEKFLLKGVNGCLQSCHHMVLLMNAAQLEPIGGSVPGSGAANFVEEGQRGQKNQNIAYPRFIPFERPIPPIASRLSPATFIKAQDVLKGAHAGTSATRATEDLEDLAQETAASCSIKAPPEVTNKQANAIMNKRLQPEAPREPLGASQRGARGGRRGKRGNRDEGITTQTVGGRKLFGAESNVSVGGSPDPAVVPLNFFSPLALDSSSPIRSHLDREPTRGRASRGRDYGGRGDGGRRGGGRGDSNRGDSNRGDGGRRGSGRGGGRGGRRDGGREGGGRGDGGREGGRGRAYKENYESNLSNFKADRGGSNAADALHSSHGYSRVAIPPASRPTQPEVRLPKKDTDDWPSLP